MQVPQNPLNLGAWMGISSVNKILNNFRTIQAITANVNLFDKA
jgi:hypothetical protein